MTTNNYTTMEMLNVDYIEIPHAIWKFKLNGFNVEDIVKIRISACRYNLFAKKKLN